MNYITKQPHPLVSLNVFPVILHEIPYDPESLDSRREERVVVAVVPVAEDDLLSAEAIGPKAAGPIVDTVHFCTRIRISRYPVLEIFSVFVKYLPNKIQSTDFCFKIFSDQPVG